MSILSKLFKTKDVRDVLVAVDALDAAFKESMGWDGVKAAVRKIVTDHPDKVKRAIIVEQRPPLEVALTLISNHCFKELSSGWYHSYRGVLGMEGAWMRTIYGLAQGLRVDRGFVPSEVSKADEATLRTNIAEAG